MKSITKYVCEACQTEYKTEVNALLCEARHENYKVGDTVLLREFRLGYDAKKEAVIISEKVEQMDSRYLVEYENGERELIDQVCIIRVVKKG